MIQGALTLEASYFCANISICYIGSVVCNFMIKSWCYIFVRLEEIIWVGMILLIAGSYHFFIDYTERVLTLMTDNTLFQALWHYLFLFLSRYYVCINICFWLHWIKGILFGHWGELLLVPISKRRQRSLSHYDPTCCICLLLLALYLKWGTTDKTSLFGATWLC